MTAEVLLVGWAEDRLLSAIETAARIRRIAALRLTPRQFAAQTTIRIEHTHVHVEPTRPLLLRALRNRSSTEQDAETTFLDSEAAAVVWAAAALTPAPVINRPSYVGFPGTASSATVTSVMRSIATSHMLDAWAEVYSSEPPGSEPVRGELQDLWTRDTAFTPQTPFGRGPYRSRTARSGLNYIGVTAVGDRCWSRADGLVEQLGLDVRTVQLERALGLGLVQVTWHVDGNTREPAVARIDGLPAIENLEPHAEEIVAALLDSLVQHDA